MKTAIKEKTVVSAGTDEPDAEEAPVVDQATIIAESIVIKSILYSHLGGSVVIDNQILSEGDLIRGAKIIKINPASVEFEVDGSTFTKSVSK